MNRLAIVAEQAGSIIAYKIEVLVPVEIADAGAAAARNREREGCVVKRLSGMTTRKYGARTLVTSLTQRVGGRKSTLGDVQRVIQPRVATG